VADTRSDGAVALGEKLHHFQVENELLHHENSGLREEAKVVRERERAEKAASRAAKLEADNTRKAKKSGPNRQAYSLIYL
jgi:hypothetical protein